MSISAICFDAFGTLITQTGRRINPYRRLVQGVDQDAEWLPFLTRDVAIDVFADELGLSHLIPVIRRELAEELAALEVLFAYLMMCSRKWVLTLGIRFTYSKST